jgi:RNA polymerase I-specific transcription initiation factor RRN7
MHRGFIELGAFYSRRFGITLPPLNAPLVLYRHIKRMAVPSMWIKYGLTHGKLLIFW